MTGRTLTLLCATLAAPALAQTAPASSPITPAYTLRAGTQLVIVDVVVKDTHGKIVHSLPQSAFTLAEGSKLQQIRNFEEHAALTPVQLAAVPPLPKLPPGEYTNLVTTPPTGALNILLFDILDSAVTNQMYMRSQLLEYLKRARPDSRTAVYALTTQLIQLQGFTSDPKLLIAALEHRGKPGAAVERDDLSGGIPNSQINSDAGEFIAHNGGTESSEYSPAIAAIEAPVNEFQQQIKAYTVLDALNQLGRNLAQLPGRKNLIWFAGDFPPEFFPSDTPANGIYSSTSALDDEFRDTVNLLSRAQVAVYPINAQGVSSNQANTADKANGRYAQSEIKLPQNVIDSGGPINFDANNELNFRTAERFSMHQIAEDTGGAAFDNSNDLALGAAKAIDDGANYYTLTYSPNGESTKEGFRHINVSVSGAHYKLSYRRGYFTDHNSRITAPSAPSKLQGSPLTQALRVGSPLPSQILMRVKAVRVAATESPAVLPGNDPNPDPKKVSGPFRTYQVDSAASVRNMSFTHGADNIIHTEVDFVTNVYDVKGTLINDVASNTIRGAYKPEEMKNLLSGGMTFNQRVSVPAKGDYFLRVAVYDHAGGHTGAVEIPVNAIASLPPLSDAPTLQPIK